MNSSENSTTINVFITHYINKHHGENDYMVLIFNAIMDYVRSEYCFFLDKFLNLNNQFTVFEQFSLTPRTRFWTGSPIHSLNNMIEMLNNIKNVINKFNDPTIFYKHLKKVDDNIAYYQKKTSEAIRAEFLR